MAQTFFYKARDHGGAVITGTIVADNPTAVASFVREKGYFVTAITPEKSHFSLSRLLREQRPVRTKDLALFCRQFSTMIDAGLSLLAALNVLIEQTENPRLRDALKDIYKSVQEGETLSHAFAQYPQIFPEVMVAMLEAGEIAGVLDQVLEREAVQLEKDYKLNEKIKSAMTYPAVVMAMACLCVIFILTFVLPTFVTIFAQNHTELPILTRALLAVSAFLQHYGLLLGGMLGVGLVVTRRVLQRPEFRLKFDTFLLKMPVFGMLWRKIAITRFSRTLSTLVKGGVPLITALEVVRKTIGNARLMAALLKTQESVKEGQGLAAPLAASRVFTPMVVQMVAIGEETGELDKMLEKIADFYDSEVEDLVSRLSSLLEPLLVAFMGIVVGLIAVAIMIPMFDVVTSVNH